VDQRVSLITLGVADLERARRFYEALGWNSPSVPALWSRSSLADDSTVVDGGGWGGVTLAYNVGAAEEVDTVLEEARAAGATIGRAGAATVWGGYSGVFIDPDGHPWEVAHNPFWIIGPEGAITI